MVAVAAGGGGGVGSAGTRASDHSKAVASRRDGWGSGCVVFARLDRWDSRQTTVVVPWRMWCPL